MIVKNDNGVTVIYSEGSNKITNKDRTFFTNMIYLGNNDSIDNYEEIPRYIWKNFVVDEASDFELLDEKIVLMNESIIILEDVIVDADYRLMSTEMKLEYGESEISSPYSLLNANIKRGEIPVYGLLKKKIERKNYTSKEEMQKMLDLYFFNNRITAEQYEELTVLLEEQ